MVWCREKLMKKKYSSLDCVFDKYEDKECSLSLMFSFLATILDSIILAHCFVLCTMYYVCNHILFTNPTLHVFPTGLAEIIGQSSIYVEHLPPPLFWCCLLFKRMMILILCVFFLVRLTLIAQDYDGSLERLAKESDCLKQVVPKGK